MTDNITIEIYINEEIGINEVIVLKGTANIKEFTKVQKIINELNALQGLYINCNEAKK